MTFATAFPATHGHVDADVVLQLLRPLRMEMGVRDATLVRFDEESSFVRVTVGMARSTCQVEIRVNGLDLFDIDIVQTRKVPGRLDWRRNVLASITDIDGESLRRSLLAQWYGLCSTKGW